MPVDAYKSVLEMPRFKELKEQLDARCLFSNFLPKESREDLRKARAELSKIVELAESFYNLLGNRHWVLHESLNMTDLEYIEASGDCDTVEHLLIEHYCNTEKLTFYISRLRQHSELQARWNLLMRAKEDHLAERYDSSALKVISIMDGFVNDVDKENRHGLFAHKPEEMVGFDCLGGHHLDLSNVMSVATKTFRKRVDEEIFEVYRNGILHGNIPNYNNPTVSCKAWNYLFAVSDWVNSLQPKPPEKKTSLVEAIKHHRDAQHTIKRIENDWSKHVDQYGEANHSASPMKEQAEFFSNWEKGRVGKMINYLPRNAKSHNTSLIDLIKTSYIPIKIVSWTIKDCEYSAPAVAVVNTTIKTPHDEYRLSFRWVKTDKNNNPVCEWEDGEWNIVPATFSALNDIVSAERLLFQSN